MAKKEQRRAARGPQRQSRTRTPGPVRPSLKRALIQGAVLTAVYVVVMWLFFRSSLPVWWVGLHLRPGVLRHVHRVRLLLGELPLFAAAASTAAGRQEVARPSCLLEALRAVLRERGGAGWLVGGTVRDRQMGRPGTDVDVVVDDDPRAVAAAVAARSGLPWFALSREWGAYRVVGSPGHLDVAAMRGGSLAADLALRDFTVNAMALPVAGGVLVDPFGGRGHLEQGRLVAVGRRIFADDPLRLLRAVRLAHTLDLTLDPALRDLARAEAHRLRETAAERVLSEVVLTLAAGRSAAAVGRWANLSLLEVFLPEVTALHGVVQSPFHHLDVYGHTLDTMERLDDLIAAPDVHFGAVRRTARRATGSAGRRCDAAAGRAAPGRPAARRGQAADQGARRPGSGHVLGAHRSWVGRSPKASVPVCAARRLPPLSCAGWSSGTSTWAFFSTRIP